MPLIPTKAIAHPIKSIRTVLYKNMYKYCQSSGCRPGVILDGDGSRALFVDDQGNLLTYEDLMMLFISYEETIKKAKGATIITSESSSQVLDDFVVKKGYTTFKSTNYPGEISRLLHEERAASAVLIHSNFISRITDHLRDATFTVLKVLEVLAKQNAPLSQLVRSFRGRSMLQKQLQYRVTNGLCSMKI